ncbi:PREDICTED: olfactory receptor 10A7-like [Nanorana parkeri]|uniref:olfactory receptor 10A7-like n=1 Tax=Nanorana parkeri TaxID=125878 RepID=UPI0008540D2E|nr:PREDICTED: olfactory receptor 10A7-like [Nanorana parkeri]
MTATDDKIPANSSHIEEFILLGFSNVNVKLQLFLFPLFLLIYVFTLLGNLTIIIVATFDSLLHTPMYYFLRNLSFLEICYISVTLPKLLQTFVAKKKTIPFYGCCVQMYCFFTLGVTECFLLAVMAYDRFVAICNPLRYFSIMNKTTCLKMAMVSWVSGNLISFGQTASIFSLPYCGPNLINHFFCDIPPLLKLACTDVRANEISVSVTGFLVLPLPFSLVLYSYGRIIAAILRISTNAGRKKVFSTCASHFASVTLFFGTGAFTYVRVKTSDNPNNDKILSLLYSVVTPLLNPLIYSLRNQEVKGGLKKIMYKSIGM